MRQLLIASTILAVTGAALAVVCYTNEVDTSLVHDFLGFPLGCWELVNAPHESARLEGELQQLTERRQQLVVLAGAARSGRMPVREAAAALQDLYPEHHGFWVDAEEKHPTWSRQRCCAALVIDLAAAQASADGQDPDAVSQSLWSAYDHECEEAPGGPPAGESPPGEPPAGEAP
jgi:hypothetical protein